MDQLGLQEALPVVAAYLLRVYSQHEHLPVREPRLDAFYPLPRSRQELGEQAFFARLPNVSLAVKLLVMMVKPLILVK